MKKFLTVLCLGLICIFSFTGCSAKGNVTKFLDAVEVFSAEQENSLDITKSLFSEALKDDFADKNANQDLDIATLEKFIQTSNLTVNKLKVYLDNENVVKKLKKRDVKDLIKLQTEYYNNFGDLINYKNSLEEVISHGSKNIKSDYDKLSSKIKITLISSSAYSKKLTDMLKTVYDVKIAETQNSLDIGEFEILVLEHASNLVYFYSKIYIEETNLSAFGNLTPNTELAEVLAILSQLDSAKFNLTAMNFTQIKNEILMLQNLNNSLISKSNYFDSVIKNFNYETLKENAKTRYPNETKIEASIIYYVSSDNIDLTTQANYNFLADLISNTLTPATNNLLTICTFLESL